MRPESPPPNEATWVPPASPFGLLEVRSALAHPPRALVLYLHSVQHTLWHPYCASVMRCPGASASSRARRRCAMACAQRCVLCRSSCTTTPGSFCSHACCSTRPTPPRCAATCSSCWLSPRTLRHAVAHHTHRHTQVRAVWPRLMELAPTPQAACAASPDALEATIHSLGFHRSRARAIGAMSHDYLHTPWTRPSQLRHVGKYASDAYFMFCRCASMCLRRWCASMFHRRACGCPHVGATQCIAR